MPLQLLGFHMPYCHMLVVMPEHPYGPHDGPGDEQYEPEQPGSGWLDHTLTLPA